jgi:uncharacterized protein (TIGR03382 family)
MNAKISSVGAVALMAVAGVAQAQFSGLGVYTQQRFFNDFPGSTLSVSNNLATGGSLLISDTVRAGLADRPLGATTLGFANRHDSFITDNGNTPYAFQNANSFTLSTDLRIGTTGNARLPRREGGFFFRNPQVGYIGGNPANGTVNYTNEGLFLVSTGQGDGSQPGEVAVFGAELPFHGFGNVYDVGQWATISITYTAGSGSNPATVQYFYSDANDNLSSPVLSFTNGNDLVLGNLSGFGNGTNINLAAQLQRNAFIDDTTTFEYRNVNINGNTVVPTPGAAAVLGLGVLALGRRRR